MTPTSFAVMPPATCGRPLVRTGTHLTEHAPLHALDPERSSLKEYTVTAIGSTFDSLFAATAVLPSGRVSVSIVAGPGAGSPPRDDTRDQNPCQGGNGSTVST
jgi:hypothetical protein